MTALMLRMLHFSIKFLICRRIDASVSLAWFKYIQMSKTFRRLLSSAIESPLILVLSIKK